MNALARSAIELRDLIERFASLSETALRACGTGDDVTMAGALDARDLVTARFTTLAAQVEGLRRSLPRNQRASADALLAPARQAALHAASVNAKLLDRAREYRMELGKQIDQLRRDQEAATAYHSAGPRASGGLDEVR